MEPVAVVRLLIAHLAALADAQALEVSPDDRRL
jgi:hypothetical protein